jgi:hypothetical protein
MARLQDLAYFMYGDVRTDRGFWYAHPLWEVKGLSEEQLFWVPDPNCLCILWHLGHIAHRERLHIGKFLQGIEGPVHPPQYETFGADWQSVAEVRASIDSVPAVMAWVEEVRAQSIAYILSLREEDFHTVPPTSSDGLSIAHWLFITSAHGAIHIGRIQMLRAMLEGKHDRPC